MIRNDATVAKLYSLLASDARAAPAPAPAATAAQKMADAMSLWRAGNQAASTSELFCDGLKAILQQRVKDNDVDLHRAIMEHDSTAVKAYRQLVANPACGVALREAKRLGDAAHPEVIKRETDPARKAQLQALAAAVDAARAGHGDWNSVQSAARAVKPALADRFEPHRALLIKKQRLETDKDVIAMLALPNAQGASSGGAARGRAVEDRVGAALTVLCNAMNLAAGDADGFRIVRSANVPPALRPADGSHVKAELDFLLMHGDDAVLVGETKAGGATAIGADCVKLRNAVAHMATRAQPTMTYRFPLGVDKRSQPAGGKAAPQALQVSGASLQQLMDPPTASPAAPSHWPASARYFLPEAVGAIPLSQRAVAYLTWRPASLEYAKALFAGETPSAEALAPVWRELGEAPKLAWIWEERALADQALHAVHGSDSIARFAEAFMPKNVTG